MPKTPRYGLSTPVTNDPADVVAHLLQLAQEIEAALAAHEDLLAAHGRASALVGVSDNQTLTGKTIDGDDNTLRVRHQDLDRRILIKSSTTSSTIAAGALVFAGSYSTYESKTQTGDQSWGVSGGASAQWKAPVDGLYRIWANLPLNRDNSGQTGRAILALAVGQTANSVGSGLSHWLDTLPFPLATDGDCLLTGSLTLAMDAGTICGITCQNATGDSLGRSGGTYWFGAEYVGPSS